MKAFSINTKQILKTKIPSALVKTNKMTLMTKINNINFERKFLLNKLSKQPFMTLSPIKSIGKFLNKFNFFE